MEERLIGHRLEWVLRGGVILGLFAFSLGCEQKTTAVGRNRLISLSSWCEGSDPVVEVRVKLPEPSQGPEINLLVISRGSRNTRVLGIVGQDNHTKRFTGTYTPDGLYNVGVPDFPVRGGEDVAMSIHKAAIFIENNRRIPMFKGQLDEVIDKVAVCSGSNKS